MRNLEVHWQEAGGDFATANVDEALAIAGLGDAVHRKVKTYSQGMRQRLGVARALLGRPELLVLDEPTNGLDPGEMREIRVLISRLADRGVTVLLSSHLLAEVEQVCSHVVVMDHGRLVAAGTIAELTAATASVYFGVDDVERARARARRAHAGVARGEAQPPGLLVELDGVARSDARRRARRTPTSASTPSSRRTASRTRSSGSSPRRAADGLRCSAPR